MQHKYSLIEFESTKSIWLNQVSISLNNNSQTLFSSAFLSVDEDLLVLVITIKFVVVG